MSWWFYKAKVVKVELMEDYILLKDSNLRPNLPTQPMTSPQNRVFRFFIVFCFNVLSNSAYSQKQSVAQKIDRFIQSKLAKSSLPGLSVAVVHGDSILLSKGYGITGTNTQVTANTPFAIASLSKAFTAMAVMQLVEAGQIELKAPVVTYLPSLQMEDVRGTTITVEQLLHQTSGLGDTGFPEMAYKEQPSTLEEAMGRFKKAHLVSTPGQKYRYHNPNYQLLAMLVEAVSHEKFSGYLQKHIFKPLKMTHSREVSATKSFYTTTDGFSDGHIFFFGKPIAIREPDWFVGGAAGIVTCANDMAHWLTLQLKHGSFENTQLLDSTHIAMMYKVPAGQPYGMGWFLTENANLHHNGVLWTHSSDQLILRKGGYGIVVLFNGGLTAFVDYYSFIQGIADILNNQESEIPAFPDWYYAIGVGVIFLIAIGLAVRRFFRLSQWKRNYVQRPTWRTGLYLFIRLLPLISFLFIPFLVTAVSGRVLNWQRIFLAFPDIILGLGTIAVLHSVIVATRLAKVVQGKRLPQT